MKTKPLLFIGICLFFCFASLCVPAYLAGRFKNILLALPNNAVSPGVNINDIEEFSKNEFLLTYEIYFSERVSLAHADYPVTSIGTTSSYPQIFALNMAEGAFFSNQAWSEKQRHAVFNEKAAFEIFGSYNITGGQFKIKNETWLATGVITDGYEDQSRVYIPSSVRGERAGALAMALSGYFDETYMKNQLKIINAGEPNFVFFNFNAQIKYFWERALVVLLCFAGLLLISCFKQIIFAIQKSVKNIKSKLEVSYAGEILKNNKKMILKSFLPAAFFAGLIILIIVIFINIAAVCLPWRDIPSIGKFNLGYFNFYLEKIYALELASRVLFIISFLAMGAFFLYKIHISRRPLA